MGTSLAVKLRVPPCKVQDICRIPSSESPAHPRVPPGLCAGAAWGRCGTRGWDPPAGVPGPGGRKTLGTWERGAPPAPTRRAATPWLPGATSSPEQLGAGRRQGAGSLPPSRHTFCPAEGQRTQFYPHFSLFFPHIRTKTASTTAARSQPATLKQEGNK